MAEIFSNSKKLFEEDVVPQQAPQPVKRGPVENSKLQQAQLEKRFAIENDPLLVMARERQRRFNESVLDYIDRMNERKRRHYNDDGTVVVYTLVNNDESEALKVRSLLVSTELKRSVPSLEVGSNELLIKTVFKPITVSFKHFIEPFITKLYKQGSKKILMGDRDAYRLEAFKACVMSWSISSIETLRDTIDNVNPVLLSSIAEDFLQLNEFSTEEEETLNSQCAVLFGDGNSSVVNADEGVRLYCEAVTFAKEFMLSGTELDKLPLRTATLIRYIASKHNQSTNERIEKQNQKMKKKK